jgi:hypothetical protein
MLYTFVNIEFSLLQIYLNINALPLSLPDASQYQIYFLLFSNHLEAQNEAHVCSAHCCPLRWQHLCIYLFPPARMGIGLRHIEMFLNKRNMENYVRLVCTAKWSLRFPWVRNFLLQTGHFANITGVWLL